MKRHYLYLNKAELVLFPAVSQVVQVIIKTARPQPSSLELAAFYLAQNEIVVCCLTI